MPINKKIKILIATYGFFPAQNYGGPPVSVENFCNSMSECEVFVVARNHEMGSVEALQGIDDGWNKRSNCNVKYLSDDEYNTVNLGKSMDETEPDLVYIQTFFEYKTFISSIRAAAKRKIPVLLAPRGELLMGAMKKKYKKIPYIWIVKKLWLRGNVFFQATSEDEHISILHYFTKEKERIFDLPNFPCVTNELSVSRGDTYNGLLKVVTLSRIVPKKNILFACEVMMDVKEELIWDVYGPIEDMKYWEECRGLIEKLPKNIHFKYKGSIPHESVFDTLKQYHVYFFPTQSENYGHSIVEAMLAGCIPVISDRTPWNDLEDYNAGYSLELGDTDLFVNALSNLSECSGEMLNSLSENTKMYARRKLNVNKLKQDYFSVFEMVK